MKICEKCALGPRGCFGWKYGEVWNDFCAWNLCLIHLSIRVPVALEALSFLKCTRRYVLFPNAYLINTNIPTGTFELIATGRKNVNSNSAHTYCNFHIWKCKFGKFYILSKNELSKKVLIIITICALFIGSSLRRALF